MPFDVQPMRQELRRRQRAFAREARGLVTADLRDASPVDSGELRRSITTSAPSISDSQISFTAQTGDLVQAETTERGARPHVIVPRSKQALAFTVGGQRVVVRRVDHPGNPARPWFHPTLDNWPQIVRRVWARVSR